MTATDRRELAYWLTLAFRLPNEPRRSINGLVLTANRRLGLGLVDLVRMEPENRPADIARYFATLDRLIAAEGKVSAQAFLVDGLIEAGVRLVPITDPAYPAHVVHRLGAPRAPTVLTILGDAALWSEPGVAVSGSRKAGAQGLAFAREAGSAVARAGLPLVCGLASGVDTEALEGALAQGGRVVGIAAEGLLKTKWRRRPEIRAGRLAVVSEFAPDDGWSAGRAMARNRTIAGFSRALVIADCVSSGGTTAQLEVHRAAGLPVYVRRGPGEGALVDELCRRPGVQPWPWTAGPVAWPPVSADTPPTPATVSVTVSADRVSIHAEAPRQLELEAVLGTIRAEYERTVGAERRTEPSPAEPALGVAEKAPPYGFHGPDANTDAVARTLRAAGPTGRTLTELAAETTQTDSRVRKRLRELVDAGLIVRRGKRYFDTPADLPHARIAKGDQRAPDDDMPLFVRASPPRGS